MSRNSHLASSLDALASKESRLVERFYERFFADHPELRELFGEHGINEREEMIRETLASVWAHVEQEPWLDANLEAMGRSHAEYGVEAPMYGWYVDTFLDVLEEIAGDEWGPASRGEWRVALERLAGTMRRAGAGMAG